MLKPLLIFVPPLQSLPDVGSATIEPDRLSRPDGASRMLSFPLPATVDEMSDALDEDT